MCDIKRVAAFRIFKSGLFNEFDSVIECVKKHFGIQAQMMQVPFLTIALRAKDVTLSKMNSLIQEERKIVRLWGLRNTLHYYTADDWSLLCSYLKNNPSWFEKRLRKSNINYDELYQSVEDIVKKTKYINRDILLDKGINKEFLGPWGDIFIDLNNNGLICNISKISGQVQYANRQFWCPNISFEWQSYEIVFQQIIIRYFDCYGPATIDDLLHWIGISTTKKNKQNILNICEGLSELMKYSDEMWGIKEQYGLYKAIDYRKILNEKVFFLGKFDPLLLAYSNKLWIVDEKHKAAIWRKSGHVSAVVMINGQACATWNYKIIRNKLIIHIFKFKMCKIEFGKITSSIFKIAHLFETKAIECIISSFDGIEERYFVRRTMLQ